MAKKEKYPPEALAAALKATNGLVYLAADRLGVAASTIYRAAKRHKIVSDVIEHQKGKRLDTAEAALWKAVVDGEAWAVCFYLKTQGKARGYVERATEKSEGMGALGELVRGLVRGSVEGRRASDSEPNGDPGGTGASGPPADVAQPAAPEAHQPIAG
jgi:hypothetical protein